MAHGSMGKASTREGLWYSTFCLASAALRLEMKNILKQYIYQTGHGKGLAKAEIEALASHPGAIVDEVEDGFVVEDSLAAPRADLRRMGGIVRITEVLQSGPENMPLNFEQWTAQALQSEFKSYKGKMRFGLSMHPKNEKVLKSILIGAKKAVKDLGNVRFVNKDFQNLSSVQAWHEHLLEPGAVELHLFKSETKWYLSRTLAIQDFEFYSHRDYDRPAKDAKNGLFPPKLAQILINIANPAPGTPVFDPFCGSGTVLQEAWLMDHPAYGSDLEAAIVQDAENNLRWFQEEAPKFKAQLEGFPTLLVKDATELTARDLPTEPFTIVSETTLGPRLTKPLTPDERAKVYFELETLYLAFFKNLKSVLPFPVTMVFTAPYHREGNLRHFLPTLPEILATYATILPMSEHERPSLFYERKDQMVSREIWKLRFAI